MTGGKVFVFFFDLLHGGASGRIALGDHGLFGIPIRQPSRLDHAAGDAHAASIHSVVSSSERYIRVPGAVNVVYAVLVPHGARIAITGGKVFLFFFDLFHGGASRRIALGDHGLFGIPIRQPFALDHAVGDIHAESIHSAVQPKAQDIFEIRANFRVLPVEVRLGGAK